MSLWIRILVVGSILCLFSGCQDRGGEESQPKEIPPQKTEATPEKTEAPPQKTEIPPEPIIEEQQKEEPQAPAAAVEGLMERFGKHYEPIPVKAKPSIPSYDLPLSKEKIGNFDHVMQILKPGDDVAGRLLQNGFAAKSWHGEDFVKAYESLRKRELPVYVTSDSVLHLYHIQFDETLKYIEQNEFIPNLADLCQAIINHLIEQRSKVKDATVKEGVDKAIAFFVVGYELLNDYSEEIQAIKDYQDRLLSEGYHYRLLLENQPEILKNAILQSQEAQSPKFRQAVNQVDRQGQKNLNHPFIAILDVIIQNKRFKSMPLELPPPIREIADQDMEMARRHLGFVVSAIFNYKEDFTQYIPRGHYTRGYDLKRYFKSMMWFGRLTFLVKGGDPHGPTSKYLVSKREARIQTIAACFITRVLRDINVDGEKAMDIWERIYGVTAFFVGLADDLTYTEYDYAFSEALGDQYIPDMLQDENNLLKIKAKLAALRKPAIYSGTGASGTAIPSALDGVPSPEELDKILSKTQGFRFMGQRFVPDSYMMGKLVFPTVSKYTGEAPAREVFSNEGGLRAFPRGLDVMALLGSERAWFHLQNSGDSAFAGYDDSFSELVGQFEKISDPEGWNINLYWSWLYCLNGLLGEYPAGYQPYMRTPPWLDKQLNTALGSWSQLRHDTILYVKQSYTALAATAFERQPKDFPGYVEPVPEFYARLQALTRLTNKVLSDMNVLDEATQKRLEATDQLLARLLDISVKELENMPLSREDERWIKSFDGALKAACVGHGAEAMKTTIIADVHTDQNSGKVLEEGTGPIGLVLVANKLPDGAIGLAAGPVFTYYEFKHPMSDRLTDEKWRTMLEKSKDQLSEKKPGFVESYFVE